MVLYVAIYIEVGNVASHNCRFKMGYNRLLRVIILFNIIHLEECKEIGESLISENILPQKRKIQASDSVICPVWFVYDNTTKQCQCYSDNEAVRCVKDKAYLVYDNYMTYSKEGGAIS